MAETSVPAYTDIFWPVLKVLDEVGGSASIAELSSLVSIKMELSPDTLNILHGAGPRSEFEYRLAWARTHLKFIGAVENSERGVWSLTDKGRKLSSETEVRELVKAENKRRSKSQKEKLSSSSGEPGDDEGDSLTWADELLAILKKIKPDAFERLCQRILRESGFTQVKVTGRIGDGGIDGEGVLRVNLISFHVLFQCKRYSGSVGAREIRDFRGAMHGRADKGLLLTTGRFTADAEDEAVRPGAQAIDLIDGMELAALLKRLSLGVNVENIEEVNVHPEFFEGL